MSHLERIRPGELIYSAKASLNELGTGFGFALSSVFANRLMISLRESYYRQQDEVFNQDTTLRFRSTPGRRETTYSIPDGAESTTRRREAANPEDTDDAFELLTFNERTGF